MVDSDQASPELSSKPASPAAPDAKAWTDILQLTLESEILPLLLAAQHGELQRFTPGTHTGLPTQADIEAFVALILADEIEEARIIVDRVIVQAGGREPLLMHLLTPAAQHLGLLWERDLCDFMDVTLGVFRLDRFMKETEFAGGARAVLHAHEKRALLLPAPGEQHSFGISMVAEVFRESGWCVRSGPAVERHTLLRLVRNEFFDVVGLSISAERGLGTLSSCIRAIRDASCNPDVIVLLGGAAIVGHEERNRFLGADRVAIDAYQALDLSNLLIAGLVKKESPKPFRQIRLT